MLNSIFLKLHLCLIIVAVFLGIALTAQSEDNHDSDIPTRYGLAAVLGKTFDPINDIYFTQISGFIMWDYDKVWRHWAPDPLRFKVEGTAGLTVSPKTRAMVSVGMMALYYLEFISSDRLEPYLEGGIGVVYTDFQVEGQGSRFNFNPQIGIGTEFEGDSGPPFFGAVRLSHISNAGLHDDNRGVNSVILMIGRFF
jgi:lipid A 3-O-deacylase